MELGMSYPTLDVLSCAEKQCASSCRRGSNLSHRFSAQQSIQSRSYHPIEMLEVGISGLRLCRRMNQISWHSKIVLG